MPTIVIDNPRAGFSSARPDARPGWRRHRLLRRIWEALAETGRRRAHREIVMRLESRGQQGTDDFDRDLQRYIASLEGRRR
jgi:hypothetical protein